MTLSTAATCNQVTIMIMDETQKYVFPDIPNKIIDIANDTNIVAYHHD